MICPVSLHVPLDVDHTSTMLPLDDDIFIPDPPVAEAPFSKIRAELRKNIIFSDSYKMPVDETYNFMGRHHRYVRTEIV